MIIEGRDYKRIFAGIGWPAEQPGFVCVVGEQHEGKTEVGKFVIRHWYRILQELESYDLDTLIKAAIVFRARYKISNIYATNYKPAMDFLNEFNRRSYDKELPTLHVMNPPGVSANPYETEKGVRISYHTNLIRESIKVGLLERAELDGTLSRERLLQVPQDLTQVTDLKYPAVAALGFCISALQTMPSSEEVRREDKEVEAIMDELLV